MNFLFAVISSVLAVSPIHEVPDADGWVSVERCEIVSEEFKDDEKKDVWAVFSKELGEEKFHVRFPDDPAYKYFSGGIELESKTLGADLLHLRVELREGRGAEAFFEERILNIIDIPEALLIKQDVSENGQIFNLFYRAEGKWVWERIQATSKYVYSFRTSSDEMTGDTHRKFIDSLDVF